MSYVILPQSLANRIAAKIPEYPAPMTLTFILRKFSTGSSFNEKAVSPAPWGPVPLVLAIVEVWRLLVNFCCLLDVI